MPQPPGVTIDNQNFDFIKDLIDQGHMIQDINASGYFRNLLIYPKKENYGVRKTCEHCGSTYKDEEAQERWREDLNKYGSEDRRLYELFKASLIYAHDLDPGKEKTQKAFDLAWDKGHSAGHYEVIQEFDELVELIK